MLSGRFEKEEEKGVQYCHHCAISFGFLSTPICNARVCQYVVSAMCPPFAKIAGENIQS